MAGRFTKERIKKDVRYQESREVTLEWWDYNYHSRVTSFFGGHSHSAQNTSHYHSRVTSFFSGIRTPRRTQATHSKKPIHLNFNINYFLRLKSAKGGFLYFYVAF